MREVLFKKEFVKYETIEHELFSPYQIEKTDTVSSIFGSNNFILSPPTKKHPLFINKQIYVTEEEFVDKFANQMYSVKRDNTTIVVEKYDDKVAIKFFTSHKSRRPGVVWFKTVKNVEFISVNLKTGDVYNGSILGYNLKKNAIKFIRRNMFCSSPLSSLVAKIKNNIDIISNNKLDSNFIQEMLKIFTETIDNFNSFDNLTSSQKLFKFYLNKRGVKFPNNFYVYKGYWVGKEIKKSVKKNDNRMVDAFMSLHQLYGKQIKKALHNCENLNIDILKWAYDTFDSEWVNQDYKLILGCLNFNTSSYPPLNENFNQHITTQELRRVFNLFKQVIIDGTLDYYTFFDHIRFYCDLKLYEPNIKWISSDDNKNKFREEHLDWADKIQSYKEGTYYREYPKYSYEFISEPIEDNEDIYYPQLLDNSANYNEESYVQSNCVKTYVNYCDSIIISLRRGGDNSNDRATIQYKLTKNLTNKSISINRVQTLGRFNKQLSEKWNNVLFKLDQRMLYYIQNEKFDTVKLKTVYKSGLELESNSIWENNGYLTWENLINKKCESNLNLF